MEFSFSLGYLIVGYTHVVLFRFEGGDCNVRQTFEWLQPSAGLYLISKSDTNSGNVFSLQRVNILLYTVS
jgi:hypothetical protein